MENGTQGLKNRNKDELEREKRENSMKRKPREHIEVPQEYGNIGR